MVLTGLGATARAQAAANQTIQDYSNIIEMDPNSAEAWWMRGNAYWDAGDYDRALADYNQTLALDPNYAMAYLGRGNVYLRKGDHDGALEEYNQVVEILPEFIGTYNNMGVAYREKGQRDLAIQSFDLALGWKPDFAEALYNRGLTYRDMGVHELAAQDLKRAVELNPNLAKATDNRGAAPGDGKQGRSPALENPKNAAEMKAQLSGKAAGRNVLNRKKGGKNGAARASKRVEQSDSKRAEADAGRLSEISLLLYVLAAGVALILVFGFLRHRARL